MANDRAKRDDPVTVYARDVTGGKIVTGELVRLACERHLRDLKSASTCGLRWDLDAALHAIEFYGFLRHWKGEWAGCQFELSPWQQFIVGSLFGWKRTDGTRRFRTAYIEVARKNGKTALLAGVGLYLLVADGEAGAEVYSAATKRDQAKLVWNDAANMVKSSPVLKKRLKVFLGKANMHMIATGSKFEPLGADADTLDGLNIHGAIIDELHAHKTRAVVDVLETATGARRQPLIVEITTAGTDRESVCWEHRTYSEQVVKRTVTDDSWFAYVATIDDGDDWQDEKVWVKANPNLGVSAKLDKLRMEAKRAREMPGLLNAFLRLHLNVWTQQVNRWIDLAVWDENAGQFIDDEKLAGRVCYGGLDLSSVNDMTAWVMVFPHEDDPEMVDVLSRFWVPEARLRDEHNRYREQYQVWVRRGFLRTTPGEAVDYSFIKTQILADAQKFRLVDLNIDRLFQAHQLATELMDEGLTVVGMGQGFTSMAAPVKEFQRRLLARKIHHSGNPVLRWMADNVAVKEDPAGNLKPDKANSQGKIDGIVALIMALDRAMRHENKQSVYEERGILTL